MSIHTTPLRGSSKNSFKNDDSPLPTNRRLFVSINRASPPLIESTSSDPSTSTDPRVLWSVAVFANSDGGEEALLNLKTLLSNAPSADQMPEEAIALIERIKVVVERNAITDSKLKNCCKNLISALTNKEDFS